MIFFIYKCYYVLFLYYSKRKDDLPWHGAMAVLTVTAACYLLAAMELFGIRDIFTNIKPGDTESTKKGKSLLFVIPLCTLVWYTIHYIVFKVAGASKTDGLSERYDVTLTKRDKINCLLFCLSSLAFAAIVVGLNALHKSNGN